MIILLVLALFAGFVDAVVGGGGLIQVPALLIVFPEKSIASLFGTNKLAAITGTLMAARAYLRKIALPWRAALGISASAFAFSLLGARTVDLLDKNYIRPFIILLLVLVFIYTLIKKDLGKHKRDALSGFPGVHILIGALIGFYDGFLGPGTGSFLIFALVVLLGWDFLTASAGAKVINVVTNLAALFYFIPSGNVIYSVALPMAAANILGALIGSRLAISKGSAFVRIVFLFVVAGLIIKLAFDVASSGLL